MDKEIDENFHKIDTRMYGNIAPYILEKACGCCEYYLFSKVYQVEDGTTYLKIFKGKTIEFKHPKQIYKNPFFRKTDAEVLSMLADKLKAYADRFAKDESLKGNWWNKKSHRQWTVTRGLDGTSIKLVISDLYKAYNVLKCKTTVFDKRIVGKKLTLDDLKRIEKAKARAEAKAKAKHKKDLAKWSKTRQISTNMYGDYAYNLLRLLCGHYYFKFLPKNMRELETFAKVYRAKNKRICLEIRCKAFSIGFDKRHNPFYNKSSNEVLAWLGTAVKIFVKKYLEDRLGYNIDKKQWNASNDMLIFSPNDYDWPTAEIKVSDAYKVVASLQGIRLKSNDDRVVSNPLSKNEMKKIKEAKDKQKSIDEVKYNFFKALCELHINNAKRIDNLKKKFEKEIHNIDLNTNLEVNTFWNI